MEMLMQRWFSGPLGSALVHLLNMSAAGAVLICVVVLLRAVLRRTPKWTRGILWAIVAVQLVCPVSLRSPLSVYRLLPRSDDAKSDQVEVFRTGGGSEKPLLVLDTPQISGYAPVPTVSPASDALPAAEITVPLPQAQVPAEPSIYLPAAGAVWLTGAALMLLYALLSWLTLRRRVRVSVPLEEKDFRLCDAVDTPFILGVIRPQVYLPSGLSDAQRAAVIAHEQAHLRRRDHWWKMLGWLLLAVHWFNPLVWLAYILFCRDVELACDEKAVRDMSAAGRADYSQALLDCAAPKALLRVCPLAFGEVGVKARIQAILNYKKPAFWIIAAAVVVCAVVAVCFLTRPGPIRSPDPAAVMPTSEPTPTPAPTAAPFSPAEPAPALRSGLYQGQYFSIRIDAESGTFTYSEADYSSHISTGLYALNEDVLTLEDTWPTVSGTPSVRRNRFRVEDGRIVWLAEDSDNFVFATLTDGASFRRTDADAPLRRMTLDDVRALSKKGEDLTWEDLAPFAGEDVGSGLYIFRFPIDEAYCLQVSDGKRSGAPQQAMLIRADESGEFFAAGKRCIDIRWYDVDAFLSMPQEAYLTATSAGQSVAAVPYLLHERQWSREAHEWIIGDGVPLQSELKDPAQLPTLTLADDFSLRFGGDAVRGGSLEVFDENLVLLKDDFYGDTAVNWLAPGTYVCGVAVSSTQGRYVREAGDWEDCVCLCLFRLIVPAGRPAPYTPAEAHDLTKATLRIAGETRTVTDAAALAKLERWLAGAAPLPGGAGCPFSSVLTLTRADGSEFSLCPAEDSCGVAFADGSYYRYAPDNAELLALFGIVPG